MRTEAYEYIDKNGRKHRMSLHKFTLEDIATVRSGSAAGSERTRGYNYEQGGKSKTIRKGGSRHSGAKS